jgi:hypothetical protein
MNKAERNIYINIRAEQIKEFQDKNNGHLFIKPYSIELATETAERQLDYDLSKGKLRISLEELLLNNNETCMETFNNKTLELAKTLK